MRLFSTPAAAIAAGCLLLGGTPVLAAPAFAPVEGGKVAYETCGSGPKALVLLHDGILDGSAFDAAWPGCAPGSRSCAMTVEATATRRPPPRPTTPSPTWTR